MISNGDFGGALHKRSPQTKPIQETTYLVQVNFGAKNFPPKVSNLKIQKKKKRKTTSQSWGFSTKPQPKMLGENWDP